MFTDHEDGQVLEDLVSLPAGHPNEDIIEDINTTEAVVLQFVYTGVIMGHTGEGASGTTGADQSI